MPVTKRVSINRSRSVTQTKHFTRHVWRQGGFLIHGMQHDKATSPDKLFTLADKEQLESSQDSRNEVGWSKTRNKSHVLCAFAGLVSGIEPTNSDGKLSLWKLRKIEGAQLRRIVELN
jgi:hypothetical protein